MGRGEVAPLTAGVAGQPLRDYLDGKRAFSFSSQADLFCAPRSKLLARLSLSAVRMLSVSGRIRLLTGSRLEIDRLGVASIPRRLPSSYRHDRCLSQNSAIPVASGRLLAEEGRLSSPVLPGDALMAVLPFRLGSRRIASRSVAAIVPALGLLAGQGCMPPGEQAGSGPGHRQSFLMIWRAFCSSLAAVPDSSVFKRRGGDVRPLAVREEDSCEHLVERSSPPLL